MPDEKGRMEILLENIQSKIDLLVEGYAALRAGQEELKHELTVRIDQAEERLGTRIDAVEKTVRGIDSRLTPAVSQHDERLRKLERRAAS